ncbi:hypothetical protein HPIN_03545 [Helicobacter pylori India7]|uniref:Uncharacterized protein n=1 Tax=Helicobacter pylori (strain India7) TaxID=907238 RepID=E8QG33_HELP7|nr:hypothetical protein HPIN_03545 [Helicobacter pylori India7]
MAQLSLNPLFNALLLKGFVLIGCWCEMALCFKADFYINPP